MSWGSTLTSSYVRNLAGVTNGTYDTQIQLYINSLVQEVENETGLDFFADPVSSISKVFKFTTQRNIFVLCGEILQPSAWLSITNVEVSPVMVSPVWDTLLLDRDYDLLETKVRPYPIYQVKFLSQKIYKNSQVRITGIKGFSLDNAIPSDILLFFGTCVSAYYNYLLVGGLAESSFLVESEKSLTRSVTISSTAFDTWKSPKLFSPLQIAEFEKVISKYNLLPRYPF